ncbi:MAG: hypothetical protein KY454_06025 [Actinobacteria bacterium]|nr:hypothetical protein [Actinomycetota bacterium]MBW3650445.1 hypothetical protein [Actinomycetota bacterium]
MSKLESSGRWYWCVRHSRAEPEPPACPAVDRLGPYDTREAAENWRDGVEARNERWDEEDRAWSGDEEE